MKIELLYTMDCPYCLQTKKLLKNVIDNFGLKVKIKETLIDTESKARKHKFLGSPTIRINGKDIQEILEKQPCEPCSKMSRKPVMCRIYFYKGKIYPYPTKGLIEKAIKNWV